MHLREAERLDVPGFEVEVLTVHGCAYFMTHEGDLGDLAGSRGGP